MTCDIQTADVHLNAVYMYQYAVPLSFFLSSKWIEQCTHQYRALAAALIFICAAQPYEVNAMFLVAYMQLIWLEFHILRRQRTRAHTTLMSFEFKYSKEFHIHDVCVCVFFSFKFLNLFEGFSSRKATNNEPFMNTLFVLKIHLDTH